MTNEQMAGDGDASSHAIAKDFGIFNHITAYLRPTSTQLLWIVDICGLLLAGFLITMGTLGDSHVRHNSPSRGSNSTTVINPTRDMLQAVSVTSARVDVRSETGAVSSSRS